MSNSTSSADSATSNAHTSASDASFLTRVMLAVSDIAEEKLEQLKDRMPSEDVAEVRRSIDNLRRLASGEEASDEMEREPTLDADEHRYLFDHSLRFQEKVKVRRVREGEWLVILESSNITLQPGIRETDEGYFLVGVTRYREGPYSTLKVAVRQLLKSIISIDRRANLIPA